MDLTKQTATPERRPLLCEEVQLVRERRVHCGAKELTYQLMYTRDFVGDEGKRGAYSIFVSSSAGESGTLAHICASKERAEHIFRLLSDGAVDVPTLVEVFAELDAAL